MAKPCQKPVHERAQLQPRQKKQKKDSRTAETAAAWDQIESPDEIGALFKLDHVRQHQS